MYPEVATIKRAVLISLDSNDIKTIRNDFALSVRSLQNNTKHNDSSPEVLMDKRINILKQSAREMLKSISS